MKSYAEIVFAIFDRLLHRTEIFSPQDAMTEARAMAKVIVADVVEIRDAEIKKGKEALQEAMVALEDIRRPKLPGDA